MRQRSHVRRSIDQRLAVPQAVLLGLAALFLGACAGMGPVAVRADDDPAAPAGTSGAPGGAPPEALREKTVYVPYEKLAEVFEKEGRGIFLPYKEFLELWQRAQPKPPPPPEDAPPAEAVISGGLYEGAVAGDLAALSVTYTVTALKKTGWSTLELPLKGVAVEGVEIRPEAGAGAGAAAAPPPLFAAAGDRYAVYLPRPGSYRVALKMAVRVESAPGRRSLAFGIPPAAISRLDLRIPEEDAQLEVKPLMAATQVAVEGGATRVLAFVGNASEVTVAWSPPAGAAQPEAALLLASQKLKAHLGERVLRLNTDIQLQILRQQVDRVRVRMPAETRVFSVECQNLREWMVEGETLEIRLHSAVRDALGMKLAFERILAETPPSLSVPFPQVEGALRESGFVSLGADKGLLARIGAIEGLGQVDLAELPEELRADAFAGFRYLAHPLRLDLAVEKIQPVIHSESTSVVVFGVEKDLWIGWIDYRITRSGVFSLAFRVPARWQVEAIGDETTVDDFQRRPAEGEAGFEDITVNLRARAIGSFQLPFRFTAPGQARPGDQRVDAPRPLGVESDRGLLGIGGPRAFRIATGERAPAVTAADAQELFRRGIRGRIPQDAEADLAFSFIGHPAWVSVTLEQRRTEIRATARVLANVTDAAVEVSQDLEYLIQFAAVDQLAFTAPSTLDERIKVEGSDLKEVRRPVPLGNGRSRWTVTLQSRKLGPVPLKISYEVSFDRDLQGLAIGQSKELKLPPLRADGEEVRVEETAAAIRKEGSVEIQPQADGLESIDPRELPPELARGRIYAAFKAIRPDYDLGLRLTRHDYVQLSDAIVGLVDLKSHLSSERLLTTVAVLVAQSSGRQYLEVRLPRGAEILSTWVAGQPVTTYRRQRDAAAAPGGAGGAAPAPDGEVLGIPLGGAGASGAAFPVRIDYRLDLGDPMGLLGAVEVSTPEVLGDVPVGKVELELFVPANYAYLARGGNLDLRDPGGHDPWRRLKDAIGALSGVQAPPAAAARNAPRPATAVPGRQGIDPRSLEEGIPLRLQTYEPVGTVRLTFARSRYFTVLDILVFAAAVAAGLFAARRFPRARWWIVLGGGAGSLLVAWLIATDLAEVFLSLFLAGALLAVVLALRGGVPRLRDGWKRWRAERLALAPDPYLEDAARPTPPPPPSPSSPPPGPEKKPPGKKE